MCIIQCAVSGVEKHKVIWPPSKTALAIFKIFLTTKKETRHKIKINKRKEIYSSEQFRKKKEDLVVTHNFLEWINLIFICCALSNQGLRLLFVINKGV